MEFQTVAEVAADIRSIYDDGTFIYVEMSDAMVEVERNDVANPEEVTIEELATLIFDHY